MTETKSLLDPKNIQNPYPFYEELRKERPITWMPELKAYFVSTYALGKMVLSDKRFQKMPTVKDGSKFVPVNKVAIDILMSDPEIALPIHCLSESGGKRFTDLRKMTDPFFGRAGAAAMEPAIQSLADSLLDEIEKSDICDTVSQFTGAYTIGVMCDVIGVPKSLIPEMKAYSESALAYRTYVLSDDDARAHAENLVRMHNVIREMLDDRRANPTNDLLTTLTQAKIEDKPLTIREQIYIVEELLMGGNDTTAGTINAGLMWLATHPDLQDTLRKNPEEITGFMEEVLRMLTSIQSGHRVAQEDIDVGGTIVKAGQKVYVGTASANRDENQFKCPLEFDHRREDSKFHMAFGGGQHFCLGQGVSRVEQRVAYESWLKRFSSFELAIPVESIRYNNTWVARNPIELPLRLKKA